MFLIDRLDILGIIYKAYRRSEKNMAEVHGNRTHLPNCSSGTPDLKSGRATSALSTSTYITDSLITIDLKNNFLLYSKIVDKEQLVQDRKERFVYPVMGNIQKKP